MELPPSGLGAGSQSLRSADRDRGGWPAASGWPSEAELAEIFQLSRITVRQALGRLSTDGLIERRQGVGTSSPPAKLRCSTT